MYVIERTDSKGAGFQYYFVYFTTNNLDCLFTSDINDAKEYNLLVEADIDYVMIHSIAKKYGVGYSVCRVIEKASGDPIDMTPKTDPDNDAYDRAMSGI